MSDADRLKLIKARYDALSPSQKAALYGSVERLVLEDFPFLLTLGEYAVARAAACCPDHLSEVTSAV